MQTVFMLICVSCSHSDGMGRTGAFICMCSEVERIRMEGITDVFQSVKAARTQRPYMVSTVVSAVHIHCCID